MDLFLEEKSGTVINIFFSDFKTASLAIEVDAKKQKVRSSRDFISPHPHMFAVAIRLFPTPSSRGEQVSRSMEVRTGHLIEFLTFGKRKRRRNMRSLKQVFQKREGRSCTRLLVLWEVGDFDWG